MRHVKLALVTAILKWPIFAGTIAALAGVGLGVALATPGITWTGSLASTEEPLFTAARTDAPEDVATDRDPVPDFALTDQDGRRVSLHELNGKVLLVNFLTTQCTTACVQVTRELRGLQQALGDRMGREVAFLSIGLDPARDTRAALRKFARRHEADFHGWAFLSGTTRELEAARRAFGALAIKVSNTHAPGSYDLEHTTTTYLLDRHGVLRKRIPPGLLTLGGLAEIEKALIGRNH